MITILCIFILVLLPAINDADRHQEGFVSLPLFKSIELVVARYNETLDWLENDPFYKYPAIIYNKGPNADFKQTDNVKKVVSLKNVGRESHTYLYHIVKNYDNLADVTVFLPGSTNMRTKYNSGKTAITEVEKTHDTFFHFRSNDIYNEFKDFQLDAWTASFGDNSKLNAESQLTPAKIRPFGKWFRAHFGDMRVTQISWYGIFAVHKRHILQHPVEYYQQLIQELEVSSNPEVGHYFERAWGAVFGPL